MVSIPPLVYITEGFALGLATGHLCIATCGPVYAPFLMQTHNSLWRSLLLILKMSAGRFVMYVLVGLVAGMLGKQLASIDKALFTAIAYVVFSVFLVTSALRSSRCEKGCAVSRWGALSQSPFLLGLATGIGFCPSFLIALTKAIDLSGPLAGALLFVAFFFGTTLFLIPFAFLAPLTTKRLFRQSARITSIIVAIWFTGQAAIIIAHNEGWFTNDKSVVSLMGNDPLYIICPRVDGCNETALALSTRRSGPVRIVPTVQDLPQKCFVMVDNGFVTSPGTLAGIDRKKRFIVVLPFLLNDTIPMGAMDRVADFLEQYHFKLDVDNGSVFFLSDKSIKKTIHNPKSVDLP